MTSDWKELFYETCGNDPGKTGEFSTKEFADPLGGKVATKVWLYHNTSQLNMDGLNILNDEQRQPDLDIFSKT